jgi:hypothetical protein
VIRHVEPCTPSRAELPGLNDEPGLLPDFAQQTICYRLVTLKDAAGRFPVRIISPLDYEHAAVLVDHNTSDAYRVARVLARRTSVGRSGISVLSRHGTADPVSALGGNSGQA